MRSPRNMRKGPSFHIRLPGSSNNFLIFSLEARATGISSSRKRLASAPPPLQGHGDWGQNFSTGTGHHKRSFVFIPRGKILELTLPYCAKWLLLANSQSPPKTPQTYRQALPSQKPAQDLPKKKLPSQNHPAAPDEKPTICHPPSTTTPKPPRTPPQHMGPEPIGRLQTACWEGGNQEKSQSKLLSNSKVCLNCFHP